MSDVKLLDLEKSVDAPRRGLGSIEVVSSDAKRMKLPLKSVELTGQVADRLAHVTVKETFTNPYSEHLEAVYIFPLSGGCAVSSFEMKVGDRLIKATMEERAAARAQYNEALQEGKRTALLEQERDDVFTVQVGNLPPGEEITVIITYSEKLPYFEDGTTEIRLPLVVAPRYIPGAPLDRDSVGDGTEVDTDQVADASRITPPRLVPGLDPKIDLKLKVVLSGNQTLEDLTCTQHVTKMSASADGITVALARENELLDRDFVLRWRVATDKIQSKFLIYKNPAANDDCFGMLSLVPPKCTEIAFAPRDVIFVVDRSGSMNGIKMVSAARACSYLLSTLTAKDRFAVQAFDNVPEWMPTHGAKDNFLAADEAGLQAGTNYLRSIAARGGTELAGALTAAIEAMKKRSKTACRQPIIVLLTDGEIGNEANIIANVQKELSDLRVFTVGIDTAVNSGFLKKLAAIGGGTASFVEPGTELEGALSQVSREIGSPLIENLSFDGINCGINEDTLAPQTMPDLFEGRAMASFFRLSIDNAEDLGGTKIRVKGQFTDGTPFLEEVCAQLTDVSALCQLWAKAHIVDLEDKFRVSNQDAERTLLHDKIVVTAKAHSVLTKFTAFVVVDQSEIVNTNGTIRKVVQPVQSPSLWERAVNSPLTLSRASNSYRSAAPAMAQLSSPPSAPPSAGGFAGAAGSYGSGVRSQVFEVVVRQAIAGAPWREICAGPMQVNNITPEEVQNEIDRRVKMMKDSAPELVVPPKQPEETSIAVDKGLATCLEHFEKTLLECFQKIQAGEMPDADALEKARTDLIAVLAKSPIASSVPLLQKYLRSDLIKLIAAIGGADAVNKQLKTLAAAQQENFESLRSEITGVLKTPSKQPL